MIWTIILRFAIQDISVEGELRSLGTLIYFLHTLLLLNTDTEAREISRQNSTSVMSPFFLRNICQGGPPPVVSEKDCPLQECKCTKLPRQVGFLTRQVLFTNAVIAVAI